MNLFDNNAILKQLAEDVTTQSLPIAVKSAISLFNQQQQRLFEEPSATKKDNQLVPKLILQRTAFIDQLLRIIWQTIDIPQSVSAIAIGGYGRKELFPYSDIDILLLTEHAISEHTTPLAAVNVIGTTDTSISPTATDSNISNNLDTSDIVDVALRLQKFIQTLWDSDLKVGLMIATIEQASDIAKDDLSTQTSHLENRFLFGNRTLYTTFAHSQKCKNQSQISQFFNLKQQELQQRHTKYSDSSRALEPNIKESPGGLRDIQNILWLSTYCLNLPELNELVKHNIISQKRYLKLKRQRNFLWRIRFALHLFTKTNENRLLFDYQRKIADRFKYKSSLEISDIEGFMHKYYRSASSIEFHCRLIMQIINERIHPQNSTSLATIINGRYQVIDNVISVIDSTIFEKFPTALFEIFLLIQQHHYQWKINSTTLKLMTEHAHLIDDSFRNNPQNQRLFIQILGQKEGIYRTLSTMHDLGLLSLYITDFADIQGLMQFDLFHIYTVDAHTLMVIRTVRKFFNSANEKQYPYPHQVAKKITRPEILYLAALMHDIGKGRGGRHAKKGAEISREFAHQQAFKKQDKELLEWLVRHHLILSKTSQKKDINDPRVIAKFCMKVPEVKYLDYLYLLTVADIIGTDPKLWNDYKDGLLRQLYNSGTDWFNNNHKYPLHPSKEHVTHKKHELVQQLSQQFSENVIRQFLDRWQDEYFFVQSPMLLHYQIQKILSQLNQLNQPVIIDINDQEKYSLSSLMLFIKRHKFQFAVITNVIARMDCSIKQAQVHRTKDGYVLYSFLIEFPLIATTDSTYRQHSETTLKKNLSQSLKDLESGKRPSIIPKTHIVDRRAKALNINTQVTFSAQPNNQHQHQHNQLAMSLITRDCHSLLALVAQELTYFNILVVGAYVTTIGAIAEDEFLLITDSGKPISQQTQEKLRQRIIKKFD